MRLLVMVTPMAATKVFWLHDESVLIETWLKFDRTVPQLKETRTF